MAYDEGLAERLREMMAERYHVSERKMFGGLAFMVDGHMFVGIVGDTLMVRVGPAAYQAALQRPHVREMDFTGKPMRGYVFVDSGGLKGARALIFWLELCASFVRTLPPKPKR